MSSSAAANASPWLSRGNSYKACSTGLTTAACLDGSRTFWVSPRPGALGLSCTRYVAVPPPATLIRRPLRLPVESASSAIVALSHSLSP